MALAITRLKLYHHVRANGTHNPPRPNVSRTPTFAAMNVQEHNVQPLPEKESMDRATRYEQQAFICTQYANMMHTEQSLLKRVGYA